MEKTTITIDMDKDSLREGVTRLIEHITMNPLNTEELSEQERIEYNMGICALFDCLRQTYKRALPHSGRPARRLAASVGIKNRQKQKYTLNIN